MKNKLFNNSAEKHEEAKIIKHGLIDFMNNVATRLELIGRKRTCEVYRCALRSFIAFRGGNDVALKMVNSRMMQLYESWLHSERGVSRNSSSFYMRALRAVYNRAVEEGLTKDNRPFKNVYTGVDRTVKRALPLKTIRRIKSLNLVDKPKLALARDLFLFSFYTRGMSFVDMAFLKKSDLCNGVLTYSRRKTGKKLQIKWEGCMQSLIDDHGPGVGKYLLPIISCSGSSARREYQSALCATNICLKQVAAMAKISIPLTTYVARHSWATAAKSKKVPLSVISECMGHNDEKTTNIYLASLETSTLDKANSLVLKELLR